MGAKIQTMRNWSTKRKALVGGIAALVTIVVIGTGIAIAGMSASSADTEGITTETVQTGDISQSVSGSGVLAAEKPANVVVPADLEVEQVLVKQGDVIDAGTPIAKVSAASVREKQLAIEENIDSLQTQLNNLGGGTNHYELKKQVLQEQIDDLKHDRDNMAQLQETLTLTSDTAGVVTAVNIFEGTKTGQASLKDKTESSSADATQRNNSAQTTESGTQQASGSPTSDGAAAVQASYHPQPASRTLTTHTAIQNGPTAMTAAFKVEQPAGNVQELKVIPTGTSDQALDTNSADSADANRSKDDETGDTPAPQPTPEETPVYGTIKLTVAAPATGAIPQEGIDLDERDPYTAEISWAPQSDAFAAQTQYACTIHLTAKDGYRFVPDAAKLDVVVPNSIDGKFELLDLDNDGSIETLKIVAVFLATAAEETPDAPESTLQSIPADGSDMGGFDLGSGYGISDSGSSSLTQPGSSTSDTEAIALSVTPTSKMFLDIKVDELDILKVSIGQKAQIKLDALQDETFTGTIVKIDNGQTNAASAEAGDGTSSKFAVRIELPHDERMRYGMSAKANITASEAKDVVLIPVAAVSDIDGKTVVYTSVDDKGILGSPHDVTTGLSDGTNVEITEGLSAGDTICYLPSSEGDDADPYASVE